jgi:ribose-phosphate pyrophosphokinase
MSDACRRAGADPVTAVIPYFGYARHDHRRHDGDAIGVRVVTDLFAAAHIDRIVGVDVHCGAIEALSSIPFVHLSALPPLIAPIDPGELRDLVVVAPDLGAAKLAQRIGRDLGAPVAFVHKLRRNGLDVEVSGVTGDVRDRVPLIVDDMISTGGTIEAAAHVLLDRGCRPSISVLATHGLFVGPAFARLGRLPIRRAIVTNSVPDLAGAAPFPIERVSLAPLLARAIDALHHRQPLEAMVSPR